MATQRRVAHFLILLAMVNFVFGQKAFNPAQNLDNFLSRLYIDDDEKPSRGQVIVDFQGRFDQRNWSDCADDKLFSFVDRQMLAKPLYRKLLALYDNYHAATGVREDMTGANNDEIDSFLDELMRTNVINQTFGFLEKAGHPSAQSLQQLQKSLKSLWFDPYSRHRSVLDSSAFEHVFVGEVIRRRRKRSIGGMHNWLRYYTLEQAGAVDYAGYILQRENLATIAFRWHGLWQSIGGFMLGTSPAFDLVAYTLCFWFRVRGHPCRFHMNDCAVNIQFYALQRNGTTIIGTIFPSPGKMSAACRLRVHQAHS